MYINLYIARCYPEFSTAIYGKAFIFVFILQRTFLKRNLKLNVKFALFRRHLGQRQRGRSEGGRRKTLRSQRIRNAGQGGRVRSQSRQRASLWRSRNPSRRLTTATRNLNRLPLINPPFRTPRRTFSERYSRSHINALERINTLTHKRNQTHTYTHPYILNYTHIQTHTQSQKHFVIERASHIQCDAIFIQIFI